MRFDTIIIGAGAAGMMCAARCGGRTLVIDHARNPGEKIRISGGGRCNFTNLYTSADNFLSGNPHFAKSALARYRPQDFLALVERHGIAWHEKTAGQLFCDGKATQIVAMLRDEMVRGGAELWLETAPQDIRATPDGFALTVRRDGRAISLAARNLVVATGGKSIPKMGATGLAYDIARQFGVPVTETRPALVPFTFSDRRFAPLSGVSLPVRIAGKRMSFADAMLFTHRGLSGPAVLQLSSYWREGEEIAIDLMPQTDLFADLRAQRRSHGRRRLSALLAGHLPARLVAFLEGDLALSRRLGDMSDSALRDLADRLSQWRLTPAGTEGYRTAEVTLGGVDTGALESASMQVRAHPGLFFIGEAVDVTGWLGGFNFQWAWASGHAAGTAIADQRK